MLQHWSLRCRWVSCLKLCLGWAPTIATTHIVALKSIYPLLSLHCSEICSCGCAERWWAILKVCRVGRLT